MQKFACFLVCLATVVVVGCAPAPPRPIETKALWHDAHFGARDLADAAEILTANDAMREYLRKDISRQLRRDGPMRGLVAALEKDSQLKLDYDAAVTRTAAQAFAARQGNCLSLTLMTASLARELGLPVRYRKVITDDNWSRRNEMLVSAGHVNILIEAGGAEGLNGTSRGLIVDFLPGSDIPRQRAIYIDETTVLAMFMNNRAVESIAAGDADAAYAWLKLAIAQAPRVTESYNTLGVLYQRRAMLDEAETVYRAVLDREPENITALANLAGVLERLGKTDDAALIMSRLRQIEPRPPLYYFDEGVAALKRGEYEEAERQFERELARNAEHSQSLAGLAVAKYRQGKPADGQRHLAAALAAAVDADERRIYADKMAWLTRQQTVQQ
jgi:Tfp pilus assembly protein PilF